MTPTAQTLASHGGQRSARRAITLTGAGVSLPGGSGAAPSSRRHRGGGAAGPG